MQAHDEHLAHTIQVLLQQALRDDNPPEVVRILLNQALDLTSQLRYLLAKEEDNGRA